jgi:hypothetical protein
MRKALQIFLGLFILGFFLKLFHIPGWGQLLFFSALILTVLTIVGYIKSCVKKDSFADSRLFELSLVLWLDYFLTRINFWAVGFYLIYFCIGISIYMIFKIKNKFPNTKVVVMILLILWGVFMFQVHSYSLYRVIYMNTLINKNIDSNIYDRYSYFLFIGGKPDEAIIAGEKAIEKSIIENGENSDVTVNLKKKLIQRENGNFVY